MFLIFLTSKLVELALLIFSDKNIVGNAISHKIHSVSDRTQKPTFKPQQSDIPTYEPVKPVSNLCFANLFMSCTTFIFKVAVVKLFGINMGKSLLSRLWWVITDESQLRFMTSHTGWYSAGFSKYSLSVFWTRVEMNWVTWLEKTGLAIGWQYSQNKWVKGNDSWVWVIYMSGWYRVKKNATVLIEEIYSIIATCKGDYDVIMTSLYLITWRHHQNESRGLSLWLYGEDFADNLSSIIPDSKM